MSIIEETMCECGHDRVQHVIFDPNSKCCGGYCSCTKFTARLVYPESFKKLAANLRVANCRIDRLEKENIERKEELSRAEAAYNLLNKEVGKIQSEAIFLPILRREVRELQQKEEEKEQKEHRSSKQRFMVEYVKSCSDRKSNQNWKQIMSTVVETYRLEGLLVSTYEHGDAWEVVGYRFVQS